MRIGQQVFFGIWAEQKMGLGLNKGEKMPFDLAKIGQLLRTGREEKGLTFEKIADALFIRKQVLRALESGDWDALPPVVYVRGYVTLYASFLDILDLVQSALKKGPRRRAAQMPRNPACNRLAEKDSGVTDRTAS